MDTAVRTGDRSRSIGRETIVLGVGDVVLVAGLLLLGQLSHDVNPVAEPLAVLETMAPFVIGWLVVAAVAGVYTRPVESVPRAARLTTVVWLAAANVGLLLRQGVFGETATWPFPLVITGSGLLLLVGWRVGYATVAARRS